MEEDTLEGTIMIENMEMTEDMKEETREMRDRTETGKKETEKDMRIEETRTDQEEGAALGNKEEDPTPRDQGEAAQEDHTENTQEVKENHREVKENLQEDQGMRYTPVRTFFWKIRTR